MSVQDTVNNTSQFKVRKKQDIFNLIHIFNGNLKNKNIQFKLWLTSYNSLYNHIIKQKNTISPTGLNDSWLSGFTDAEGCFTVSATKSKLYNSTQVTVRYIVSQKSDLNLLSEISILLDGKLHYLKSYDGYNMTVSLTKLGKTIAYFNKYNQLTKKKYSYVFWYEVYKLVIAKKHLTRQGLYLIKTLMITFNK